MSLNEAKKMLQEKSSVTFVCVKNGKSFISEKQGIVPMMDILEENEQFLEQSAVADKVVGKAVALLMVLGKISCVYAKTISSPALNVLQAHNIQCEYKFLVSHINNRSKDGLCPMEQCVWEVDDPLRAKELLTAKLLGMRKKKTVI